MRNIFLVWGIILLVFLCVKFTEPVKADTLPGSSTVIGVDDITNRPGDTAIAANQPVGVDDHAITDAIHKAIVNDKNLSLAAEKIDIASFNGYVTLKGVVKDQKEKETIEHKAQAIDQVRHVDNKLTIETGS